MGNSTNRFNRNGRSNVQRTEENDAQSCPPSSVVPQVRNLPEAERDPDRKKLMTSRSEPVLLQKPKHDGSPLKVTEEHTFLVGKNCAICVCEFEVGDTALFPYKCCIHPIHCECFEELLRHEVSLRCPSCRKHIDMTRSLKDNSLPPLQVHCGFNSCFGFPDGIFTMSMQYRTADGPIRGADGHPLMDFGTVAVNIPPVTKGRWYYEAVILIAEERKNLAWQPGWMNTDFKITEPKSQVLGLCLGADAPTKFGKMRMNSYQGVGDDHEGNSYAFDPIRHQLWYRDLPPIEGRYQRYRGVSKLLINMLHQQQVKVIRFADDENGETLEGNWEHTKDSLFMVLDGFEGRAELRPQTINMKYFLYLNFTESNHIFLSIPNEIQNYRMWRRGSEFIDFEKAEGEIVEVSRENEKFKIQSTPDSASLVDWEGILNPDIKRSEMTDTEGNKIEVLFSEVYDMMVRFNSDSDDEYGDLWVRIPEEREAFTRDRVLGCCLDCEARTIDYWVDDEHKARFTDIVLGSGMIPALSFTGMLPSKLILRRNDMRFNPNEERGTPVSDWWDEHKKNWKLESRLEANPTVYIFKEALQKLKNNGEDVEHIISQFTNRFGFVGFLDEEAEDDPQINIHLPRPDPNAANG